MCRLETVDFDGLGIHFETRRVDEKVLHGIALISLQLNNITSLLVLDYGTIASKLLLDNLQDFLEVELCWDTFDGGQSLAAVALLDTDVDVCGSGQLTDHTEWWWRSQNTSLSGFLGCFARDLVLRIRKWVCV